MTSFFKRRYRVVTDRWCGYEVQWRSWWVPFWIKRGNTHNSVYHAEQWAKRHAAGLLPSQRKVRRVRVGDAVRHLGRLP